MKMDEDVYEKLALEIAETNESLNEQTGGGKLFYEGYRVGFYKAAKIIGINKMELFVKLQKVKIKKAINEINKEEELKNE